jgi:hypothetical protein
LAFVRLQIILWLRNANTCYRSCPQIQCRSWPPSGDPPRLLKQLASVLRELDVDQKTRVTSGDGGFTYMVEPSERCRGKARCKFSFLACQLSVFFTPSRYRVVKIVRSCFKVVMQTTKNYKAHYNLSWFRPLLRGNCHTSSVFVLKKNSVTMG